MKYLLNIASVILAKMHLRVLRVCSILRIYEYGPPPNIDAGYVTGSS